MLWNLIRKTVPVGAVVGVLLGSAAADLRAQNLVQNPGFEAGRRYTATVDNWSMNLNGCSGTIGDPSVAIGTGRTYVAPGPLENPSDPWITYDNEPVPHTGYSDMWFGAPEGCLPSISQTLATVAGEMYNLDFWLNLNSTWGTSTSNLFEVQVNGATLFLGPITNFSWAASHYTFTAAGNDRLEFFGNNPPGATELDDVSVTSTVPEPASMTLLATGLAGLAAAARRRKRSTKA